MIPGLCIAGVPTVLSSSPPAFRSASTASGSGSSITLAKPSGVAENDLLLAVIGVRAQADVNSPSGFQSIERREDENPSLHIYAKSATATEPTDYEFDLPSSEFFSGAMLCYQNSPQVDTSSLSPFEGTNDDTITANSITANEVGILIAVFVTRLNEPESSGPESMTQRVDLVGSPSLWVYDLDPSPAGATGAKTLTLSENARNKYGALVQIY